MADRVKLIGLDFGTTTSSAVIAAAQLRRTATGRIQLDCEQEIFRSEMVFTPLRGDDRIDVAVIDELLDSWLAAGQVQPGELFGGGALLTGLTAQKENAAALVALIRRRVGDALVATADDPCLESWLAFMGSCSALSHQHPDRWILNLDIGGGTTNIALGRDRQVLRTGCLFLGARHVQVVPGTYRIVRLSPYARQHFSQLGIGKGLNDDLSDKDIETIVASFVAILTAQATQDTRVSPGYLEQVRFQMPVDVHHPIVTFSGGVGELVYRHLQREPWPSTTHFGDLGIDFARAIVESGVWTESLRSQRSQSAGRATVYGLLRHATEVSGSTLFLGGANLLPLADLPIFGTLAGGADETRIRDLITLVRHSPRGGCVQVRLGSSQAEIVRRFSERLAAVLDQDAFPATHPLVLLVEENVGKVLGQYVTRWGALALRLVVIDEVAPRDAQYLQIGAPRDQVVPVSFYGFHPGGEIP